MSSGGGEVMERKLTILMRALLAVALVAITLVLTYEFWRAGNGKSSLDVQEIRFAGVYQPEGGFRMGCMDAGNIPRQCPLSHRGAAGTF